MAEQPTAVEQLQEDQGSPSSTESTNEKKGLTRTAFGKFLGKVFVIFVMILFYYYFCSGFTLYIMKVAQANLFDDQCNCFPYTDAKSVYKDGTNVVETNIYETYETQDGHKTKWQSFLEIFGSAPKDSTRKSQKLNFPLTESAIFQDFNNKFESLDESKTKIETTEKLNELLKKVINIINSNETLDETRLQELNRVRSYIEDVTMPLLKSIDNNFFPKFFRDAKSKTSFSLIFGIICTVESMVCAMNSVFNKIYAFVNESVSEFWVYHLFPLIMFFPFLIIAGLFQVYNLILSVSNLKYFLRKKNTSWDSPIESDNWQVKTEGWWTGALFLVIAAFSLGWLAFMTTTVLTAFLMIAVLVSKLNKKSINEKGQLESGWSSSWKSMQTYKNSITIVFLFMIINAIFECFGDKTGYITLIVFVLGNLFNLGFLSVYEPLSFQGFTNVTSYVQQEKECTVQHKYQPEPPKEEDLLSKLGNLFKQSLTIDPSKLKQKEVQMNEINKGSKIEDAVDTKTENTIVNTEKEKEKIKNATTDLQKQLSETVNN